LSHVGKHPARRPRPGDGGFALSVIGIEFVGSRHLVFNWGLLGNPSW
jgi:hypothetical protein